MLETVRGLQQVRVPAAPVSTMAELYNDEHLKSREFFVPMPGGEAPSWRLARLSSPRRWDGR